MTTEGRRITERDVQAVKDRVNIVDLVGKFTAVKKRGRDYWGCCPFHGERTPSFRVREKAGDYKCFACGAKGDAIDFARHVYSLDFAQAVRTLAGGYGLSLDDEAAVKAAADRRRDADARRQAEQAAEAARSSAVALETWQLAYRDLTTGPADPYLRGRGVDPGRLPMAARAVGGGATKTYQTWPATLRWQGPTKYFDDDDPDHSGTFWPIMVAAMQLYDTTLGTSPITGVHRTYLRPDGSGKADVLKPKKMRGPTWGGAVRFGPATETLGLSEGNETGLSVVISRPVGIGSVWAAGSLGHMCAVILPPIVKRVVLLMDNDSDRRTLEDHAVKAARFYRDAFGATTSAAWAPADTDFNDVLQGEKV